MAEINDQSLARTVASGVLKFILALALLIFIPVLRIDSIGIFAWAHFSFWIVAITLYLYYAKPELLRRRMQAGARAENEPEQKRIQLINAVLFVLLPVISGIDRAFVGGGTPFAAMLVGHALTAIGFLVILVVFRENSYAASTVAVEDDQPVVTTGPYALVRHPMYSGGALLIIGMPLALGSWWGLAISALLVAGLVARLLHEEQFLAMRLPGYDAYQNKVRARLLPGVW